MQKLPLLIGWRFVRAKNNNKFLSFISWLSMLGLILGVSALIIITSVFNGFEKELEDNILGMVPHVILYSPSPLTNWTTIAKEVEKQDTNIKSAAPLVQVRGMLSINGELGGTIINGIDPNSFPEVSVLNQKLIVGSLNSLNEVSDGIILGKYLVDKYNLKLGDKITVIINKPANNTAGVTPTFNNLKLIGVFHVSQEVDKWLSYSSMNNVSSILDISSGATSIIFKLNDINKSQYVANHIRQILTPKLGENLIVRDWKKTHSTLYSSIKLQKIMLSVLLFLIVLVASFNIMSSLVMSITEKETEIAILKTYGATDKLIKKIFFVQSSIISIIGISIGLFFGLSITYNITYLSAFIDRLFNLNLFESYYYTALPAVLQVSDVLVVVGFSYIIVLIATIYPASKAAKILPHQSLK